MASGDGGAREAAGRRRAEEAAAARRTRAAAEATRNGDDDARAKDLRALGLDAREIGASDAEVARAYRRAALRYHPDKQGGDDAARERATEMFVAATEAFERLARRGRE